MEQFKYIQPLDQMERISRTELGEKLDEILDKVDKNNVGFVITDNGKDDLVLCPIRWIECTYNQASCVLSFNRRSVTLLLSANPSSQPAKHTPP